MVVIIVLSLAETSFSDMYHHPIDFWISSSPRCANYGDAYFSLPLFDTSLGTLESVTIDVSATFSSSWYIDLSWYDKYGPMPLAVTGESILVMYYYRPIRELDFAYELIRAPFHLSGDGFFLSGTNTVSATIEFVDPLIIDSFIESIDSGAWVEDNVSGTLHSVISAVANMHVNAHLDIAYNYNPGIPSSPIFIQLPPVVPVPVPGAVILGSIGLSFSGWLLRRRRASH